ncbi:MAG: PxxKW family cysteine-rich protein [Pseudomonadota bacterium]
MQCVTVKEGAECSFMTKKGCAFNGGTCQPIVEQCQGCDRTVTNPNGVFCRTFPDPAAKWRRGPCNMATHVKVEVKKDEGKKRVGQQKQKKK